MKVNAFVLRFKSWEKICDIVDIKDAYDFYEAPYGITFNSSEAFFFVTSEGPIYSPRSSRALWFRKKSDRDSAYAKIVAIASSSDFTLRHIDGVKLKGVCK